MHQERDDDLDRCWTGGTEKKKSHRLGIYGALLVRQAPTQSPPPFTPSPPSPLHPLPPGGTFGPPARARTSERSALDGNRASSNPSVSQAGWPVVADLPAPLLHVRACLYSMTDRHGFLMNQKGPTLGSRTLMLTSLRYLLAAPLSFKAL